jgi:iron-regulated transporter 1
MTAFLRRIDLTTNILAPIGVGQIFTYGSLFIGAVFIAAWNVISFFIEYYLLWKVYHSVPALASKKKKDQGKLKEVLPANREIQSIVKSTRGGLYTC